MITTEPVPAPVSRPMLVGVITVASDAAFAGSLGVDASNGSERTVAEAVIARINRTGGLGGRKLQALHHEIDPTRDASKSEAQLAAEICAKLTQDNHVEAVVYYDLSQPLAACLQRAAVPLLTSAALAAPSEQRLRELTLLAGVAPSTDRYARTYAADLVEQGFFRGSKGSGLVVEDRPQYRQVAQDVLVPALHRAGVDVDVVFSPTAEPANFPAIGSAMANAGLKWRTEDRDRVLFLVPYSIHALLFMEQAEQQQYRPTYGLNSGTTPNLLAATASPNQLHGAVGVGIAPSTDAAAESWRVDPPGLAACRADQRRAGLVYDKGSAQDLAGAYVCDELMLLKAAADALASRGLPVLGPRLMGGITALGGSFRAASSQGTFFSPTTRPGGARYQRMAYVDACSCFHYTSGPLRLP